LYVLSLDASWRDLWNDQTEFNNIPTIFIPLCFMLTVDKLLLDLADVSQRQQSGDGMEEHILPLGTNDETVLKDNEVQAAVRNESSQGSNVSNIAVTVQEDVETTTTHKVVTSYVESLNLS